MSTELRKSLEENKEVTILLVGLCGANLSTQFFTQISDCTLKCGST